MSTLYEVIDNSFLNKITDDYLLTLFTDDLYNLIDSYRKSASIKFKQCKKLQDRDDELEQFNQTLTDEEIEILANLMVLEWLKPRINSIEALRQTMASRDYTMYSQAQHLDVLIRLKKSTNAEIDTLIVSYTYSNNSLDDLGKV